MSQSVQAYKKQEIGSADLANMGISPFHSGAYGYLYNERKGFTEDLARGTGSVAGSTKMMGLARSRNIDLGTMGGFASSLYQTTGLNGKGATDFTAGIIGTNTNTKQMVTILDGVAKMLKGQEQRQGALVGGAEAKAMAGLFSLNFGKSPLLQNTSLYDKANSAIAGGGQNPGEQLLWWKMAGGDDYKGGFGQLLDIKSEQRKGIFGKKLRNNLKKYLGGMPGGRDQQLAFMDATLGLKSDRNDPQSEGALMLDNVFMSDTDFNNPEELRTALEKKFGKGKKVDEILGKIAMSKTLANEQQREEALQKLGGKFTPGLQKTEAAIIKGANDLLDGKKGALKNGFNNVWNSGWAGKVLIGGAVAGAGYGGYKAYNGAKKVASAVLGGAAGTGGATSAASRRLPFFAQSAKYMKWLGRATGAGIAADILLNAKDAGGGYEGNEEGDIVKSSNPRETAAAIRKNKADGTGGVVTELQAISITLAMILTLLSGVINIGGANAEGAPR
jgi:hypothetical protein